MGCIVNVGSVYKASSATSLLLIMSGDTGENDNGFKYPIEYSTCGVGVYVGTFVVWILN
jgi:hypothetical protein